MNILEKEIEDVIYEAIQNSADALSDRGLRVYDDHCYVRQPDLGSYGRADIVGFLVYPRHGRSRIVSIHVMEIKKDVVNQSTINQAIRYCAGILRLIQRHLKRTHVSFDITLVGKSIDVTSDFVYYADIIPTINFYTYSIDLVKGIRFERQRGYHHSKEVLPKIEEYMEDILWQITPPSNLIPKDWGIQKEPVDDLPF